MMGPARLAPAPRLVAMLPLLLLLAVLALAAIHTVTGSPVATAHPSPPPELYAARIRALIAQHLTRTSRDASRVRLHGTARDQAPLTRDTSSKYVAPLLPQRRADFRVHDLPGIDLPLDEYELYAGHMRVDDKNSTEFFMYFERETPSDELVVWLNGGPGASSLFGLFVENGPFTINLTTGTPTRNPHGWHRAANLLFLENPAGVGFSTVLDDEHVARTIHDVSEQFWQFAQSFLRIFQRSRTWRWFLVGESFGGMYVPHIAAHILAHNGDGDGEPVPLEAVAVGNGVFFSPSDMPVNWVDYFAARGLLASPTHRADLFTLRNACAAELADPARFAAGDLPECEALTARFTNRTYVYEATRGTHCLPTFYDVRVTDCDGVEPTDVFRDALTGYLNRADVQRALHATSAAPVRWDWFDRRVYNNLYWNGDQPSIHVLPSLVDAGLRVMLYNGDLDIICNHVGMENTLKEMSWGGETGFVAKRPRAYVPRGDKVGEYWRERGVTYLKVEGAGHMVPFNKPRGSLQMIVDFIRGEL
ncbi:Cell death protease [Allomyces arbusculus]|nr:Cell death protease [Allomyces arbusculus]